jgi:GH24 family phage-related lysozyme (muramidase)
MTQFQGTAENLIKRFEGFQGTASWDVNAWAVGYGFRKGVTKGQKMSKEEADIRLSKEVKPYAQAVESMVTNRDISEKQKAALTSFAYNAGIEALHTSTLLKKVNAGDIEGAAQEFAKWSNVNKTQFNAGLYKRRMQERAIFLGGKEGDGADAIIPTINAASNSPAMDVTSVAQSLLAQFNALAASFGHSSHSDLDSWTDRLRQEGRGV